MRRLFTSFGLCCLGLVMMAWTPAAHAANIFELNFGLFGPGYEGKLPACEAALPSITHQFGSKEREFWNSALEVTSYYDIRETAFRPWQSDNIPRRYCSAHAMFNDGRTRTVHFSIIEDGGFAGFADGVEFCVVGLDRNWAFNPACKAARP